VVKLVCRVNHRPANNRNKDMKSKKQKITGPNGLVIELDASEVYRDNPGQGTPAMVYRNKGLCDEDSGTFWCAVGEGELSYHGSALTQEESDWLASKQEEVDRFIEANMPAV